MNYTVQQKGGDGHVQLHYRTGMSRCTLEPANHPYQTKRNGIFIHPIHTYYSNLISQQVYIMVPTSI